MEFQRRAFADEGPGVGDATEFRFLTNAGSDMIAAAEDADLIGDDAKPASKHIWRIQVA